MLALAAGSLVQRPHAAHSFKPRRNASGASRPAVVRAVSEMPRADLPVASDLPAEMANAAAVRKALLARGWDLAWIDGVTGEMQKRRLQASVPQIEAVVSLLEGLGIPTKSVENMVSINKQILAQPTEALQAVADYVQRQGASGAALVTLLEAHPNLLTYAVAADGKRLEKGQARASVDVAERGGRRVAGVSYWREGTAFATAPVSPGRPSGL